MQWGVFSCFLTKGKYTLFNFFSYDRPSCPPPGSSGMGRQAPSFSLSVSSISRTVWPHLEMGFILLIVNNIICVLKRLGFSQVIHIFFSS